MGIAVTDAGYWVAKSNGVVTAYGAAVQQPRTPDAQAPIVSISAVPGSTTAYYLLAANGTVIPVGGAKWLGDPSKFAAFGCDGVSITASPDGTGYMIVTSDGGAWAYGDEYNYGGQSLAPGSISGFAANPSETGYWELGNHGHTYPYGSVPALCSLSPTARRTVAIASTGTGEGLWIASTKGDIWNCGDAAFFGSPVGRTTAPIVAMSGTLPGQAQGYYLLNRTGTVFPYGAALSYPRS